MDYSDREINRDIGLISYSSFKNDTKEYFYDGNQMMKPRVSVDSKTGNRILEFDDVELFGISPIYQQGKFFIVYGIKLSFINLKIYHN